MKIYEFNSYGEMSEKAADIIADKIKEKPDSVLGLATGSTPLGIYRRLIEMYDKGELDFSKVKTYNLDEYIGIPENDPQSYHFFMNENLFRHINVRPENIHIPNGNAEDIDFEGREYDRMIHSLGGADIQILGIGLDGHIGFNEPGEVFIAETHRTALDTSTIKANSRFFASPNDVPKYAITMGMYSILAAKKILLVANSEQKIQVVRKAFSEPVNPKLPASILQLHKDVTVILSHE